MSDLLIAALVGAIPPTVAVLLTHTRQSKKIEQVHGLVNSRLEAALSEVRLLKRTLKAAQRRS